MDQLFAIITFRATGPIKTWSDMRGANVHNARTKPIEHAVLGAPVPEHLIGSGDLVADAKARLRLVGIDPIRMRKNGVIAYEAILSASTGFFDDGSAEERAGRLTAWKAAQHAWALKRYGAHRVVSMVLHIDEKVPHIHLVVIPLKLKTDGRRKDTEPQWALVGRTISGPGKFDQVQDEYAAAMAPFGLSRGVRGSGRKHEPVPVYLARMAAKEQAVDAELGAAAVDRAQIEAERLAVERRAQEIADRAAQLDRNDAARRRQLQRDHDALISAVEEDRQRLRRWDGELVQGEKDVAAGEADLASRQASFARFRDELVATREKLVPIVAAAKEFLAAAAGLSPADVAPAARPAVGAAHRVLDACRSSQPAMAAPTRVVVDSEAQSTDCSVGIRLASAVGMG